MANTIRANGIEPWTISEWTKREWRRRGVTLARWNARLALDMFQPWKRAAKWKTNYKYRAICRRAMLADDPVIPPLVKIAGPIRRALS